MPASANPSANVPGPTSPALLKGALDRALRSPSGLRRIVLLTVRPQRIDLDNLSEHNAVSITYQKPPFVTDLPRIEVLPVNHALRGRLYEAPLRVASQGALSSLAFNRLSCWETVAAIIKEPRWSASQHESAVAFALDYTPSFYGTDTNALPWGRHSPWGLTTVAMPSRFTNVGIAHVLAGPATEWLVPIVFSEDAEAPRLVGDTFSFHRHSESGLQYAREVLFACLMNLASRLDGLRLHAA